MKKVLVVCNDFKAVAVFVDERDADSHTSLLWTTGERGHEVSVGPGNDGIRRCRATCCPVHADDAPCVNDALQVATSLHCRSNRFGSLYKPWNIFADMEQALA